ncbi:CPBP family intramembrane glutamic endopeptidase [Raoultibacter phocaeensis]|uniref:CPBP family intramembrane glutamic endopeptidase n=1 Tax=Raoultibacter phocaeensis TaxID=2479841 RepID=UPI00111A735F|nr:type II CAAX endopeptidase family protein [Raoultibacter phocaeensis]
MSTRDFGIPEQTAHVPQMQTPFPPASVPQKREGIGIRLWRAAYPVLLVLGVQAVAGFVLGMLIAANPQLYRMTSDFDLLWLVLVATVASQIAAVPFLVAFRIMDENRLRAKGVWKRYRLPNFGYLALCLGIGIGMALLALCLFELIGLGDDGTQVVMFASHPFVSILVIGLIGPAVEELVFRVLLFGRLREWMGPVSAGLLSALVFTLAHGNEIQGVTAFFYGLALAFVYEKFKTFWAPFLLHAGVNSTVVLTAVVGRGFLVGATLPFVALASAAVVVGLVFVAYRARLPKERE